MLTGIGTASTAEDLAIEMEFSGRAVLVGERTPGSAGNPIRVPLPGGGTLRVATFKSYYPDGTEYMHSGVKPDVEVVTTQKNLYDGVEPIIEKGIEVINNWTAFSKTTKKFKTSAVAGISEILNHKSYVYAKSGIDDIVIHGSEYYFLENEFINYGYDLIKKDRINDATEIFKMTTELYPASWNAYDSYAEALMKKGENEGAIENYKRSLKLNPDNQNGKEMLKLLNGNK